MGLFQDLAKHFREIRKMKSLYEQEILLTDKLDDLDETNPERAAIIQQREFVQREISLMSSESAERLHKAQEAVPWIIRDREQRESHPDLYYRPLSFVNKHLGPIPPNAKKLDPNKEQMRNVETHGVLVACMCIGGYAILQGLTATSPWLAGGLNALWNHEMRLPDYTQFSLSHVVCIICVLLLTLFNRFSDKHIYRMAADREQRFNMGSENWTWPQRAASYFASLLPWVMWLLFFPSLFIAWICVPVPILSKLYLDTFKRTGDFEYATLTTTKFYGQFLKYFLLTISTFTLLPWIMTLVF